MAEAESQTNGDCEEQRRCLAISKTILHRRLPLPPVNHNDCNRDSFLCVFPLESIRPAARRDRANGKDTSWKQRVWEM